jgi:hypothetical protein
MSKPAWLCQMLASTLTPNTESMFHSVSFHAPYFEIEWAKSKWVNPRIVVSKVYYNSKKTEVKSNYGLEVNEFQS